MYDFFTGLDVEHFLKENSEMLPKTVTGFDVYTDRVVFYKNSGTEDEEVLKGIGSFLNQSLTVRREKLYLIITLAT